VLLINPLKKKVLGVLPHALQILWLFTKSDFSTFVLPNTAFGLFGAFSRELDTTRTTISIYDILLRAPSVLIFNWSNLLIFDLSNQRSPESAEEDRINKPWRPIPRKMITCEQTRRLTIACIPLVFVINLALGVSNETAVLYTLTWLYNDLRGGDELFIRDGIISVAFGVYNTGSLRLAIGSNEVITKQGYIWIAMISGVILTTMNIQDLRDEAGDSVRGRVTVPLALGSTMARKLLVFFITLCSLICSLFWGQSFWIFLLPLSLGLFIAHRLIYLSGRGEDTRTWKFWCLWCATLYLLPCVSKM
jgi:4-hydroxybenzoate polyprenyltransferase